MTRKGLRKEGKSSKGHNGNEDKDDGGFGGDERFAKALSNPLFKKTSVEKNKVVLDDRFKGVLTDEKFRILPGGDIDSKGRKVKSKSKEKQALKELESFYTIDPSSVPDEENEEAEEQEQGPSTKKAKKTEKTTKQPVNDEDRLDYLNKLARGEIDDDSEDSDEEDEGADSSMDEDDEDLDEDDEEIEGDFKSPLDIPGDEEEVECGDATTRLSILNCDWENIKSDDLLMILQSFCPPGKKVKSVTIYPSDYGKERMEEEAKYGPQGIWKKNNTTNSRSNSITSAADSLMEEENEEENDDLYEGIEELDNHEDDEEEEEEDEEEKPKSKKGKHSKRKEQTSDQEEEEGRGEEFRRKKGAVGIVLHDDLLRRRGKRSSSFSEQSMNSQLSKQSSTSAHSSNKNKDLKKKKQPKTESDYDEVALRQYELSKLRYYFAIAECDTIETANILYEQLDDVELGDSAMAIELRFVPDDLDLTTRDIRDSCHHLPHHYQPPQFVINALQHTKVECSWDKGETEREKKLTNISSWRTLRDSELMQYIASSDSEDYEDEEEENNRMMIANDDEDDEEEGGSRILSQSGSVKSMKKKKRAKQLRKLLLGDSAGAAGSDDDEKDHDDFFAQDPRDGADDDMPQPDENGEITFTYMPEAGKDLIAKKKAKEQQEHLTPYEMELQKTSERKKAKKLARKEHIQQKQEEQKELIQQVKDTYYQKKKQITSTSLKEEEDQAEYNDEDRLSSTLKPWEIEHKQLTEKKKKKLEKKLKKKLEKELTEDNNNSSNGHNNTGIDLSDDRFKRVFEGDSKFGIDRTSNEFKSTPGMETILQEQRKRREKKSQQSNNKNNNDDINNSNNRNNDKEEIHSLANKLKRKFSAVN